MRYSVVGIQDHLAAGDNKTRGKPVQFRIALNAARAGV
jgi:hypothetical protein